jgi:hypothetical protein
MPLLRYRKPDANEAEIVQALCKAGAEVQRMDRKDGFDLLVGIHYCFYALEVKKVGEDMTENERDFFIKFGRVGAPCYVVHNVSEALEAIGLL